MKPSRFILGLILILAGTIFFLINLGYGSLSILRLIPQFWPVLMILTGLSLLWKGVIPPWFGYSIIIVITAMVILLFVMAPESGINSKDLNEEGSAKKEIIIAKETHPNLAFGKLDLEFGGGQLFLEPATNESNWFAGQFNRQNLITGQKVNNDHLELNLKIKKNEYLSMGGENLWKLLISPQINWEIHLKAGALHGNLNLVGLPFQQITLNVGAGDIDLVLGDNGKDSKLKVNAGASNIKVKIPEQDGVKIMIDGALNRTNLDELPWRSRNNGYVSPNYETAENKVRIELNMAVSNLQIEIIPKQGPFDKLEAL